VGEGSTRKGERGFNTEDTEGRGTEFTEKKKRLKKQVVYGCSGTGDALKPPYKTEERD
jgi:hypothetical protein